jgi:hypothetical protein
MENYGMRILGVLFILFLSSACYASQNAITDTGEDIVIYSDGTWKYPKDIKQNFGVIKVNKDTFKKPEDSSFLLKSTTNKSAYWINTNKWSFSKTKSDAEAVEYEFQLKGKDLYGMAITEEIETSLQSLTNIALSNAQDISPDFKILKKEHRTVNGKKVIFMEMGGTLEGMKLTYLGYYYSDANGITQLLLYTSSNLVAKYKTEIDKFLNGLVVQ